MLLRMNQPLDLTSRRSTLRAAEGVLDPLEGGRHFREFLERAELRQLCDKLRVVKRIEGVLMLKLRHQQLQECILPELAPISQGRRTGCSGLGPAISYWLKLHLAPSLRAASRHAPKRSPFIELALPSHLACGRGCGSLPRNDPISMPRVEITPSR